MPDSDDRSLTVQVHPAALLPGDLLLADPDVPEREVRWRIGVVGREGDVIVAEYVTEDDTEGRHGFEDPTVWLTVAVRPFDLPVVAA
jgi:hypothetical protein